MLDGEEMRQEMERLKESDAITEAIREFGKVRLPAWCVRSSVCARPHLALAGMPLGGCCECGRVRLPVLAVLPKLPVPPASTGSLNQAVHGTMASLAAVCNAPSPHI